MLSDAVRSFVARQARDLRAAAIGAFCALHVGVVVLGSLPSNLRVGPLEAAVAWTAPARRAYGEWLGCKQGWSMFSRPARQTGRVEVDVLEQGRWEPLYVARSPTATWRRTAFDHYRWREAFSLIPGKRQDAMWTRATDWIAARALEDRPHAERVRIEILRAPLRTAHQLAHDEPLVFQVVKEREVAR